MAMKTWAQFLVEKQGSYSYSSCQFDFPPNVSKQVFNWGKKNIPDNEVYEGEKDDHEGRQAEDDIHVTILYGLHASTPNEVQKLLKTQKPFNVTLGKVSMFDSPDCDVVKVGVEGEELHKLNRKLRDNCEYTNSYDDYIPHVTIAYVKKGKGKKHVGNKDFAGISARVDSITFSSKDGNKTNIKLS